jgi:lipoprotein-anchoring transpeptidase ErfK/SrfK
MSVALRNGVALRVLEQVNALSGWRVTYPGQQLIVPLEDGGTLDLETSNLDTHGVRPGDSLEQIALRYSLTSTLLARLNGIVNPTTIRAEQILRLTDAVPLPSGGGKYIVMDISEQHLYAYRGDELVYSFVASSGASPYVTRTGDFRVQSKIPNAYGSTWDIWMPYWMGIYWAGSTENGIHALPVMANGVTLWAGYLGTPVSYGCIVLDTYEAKLLYEWVEIGTPITVQH